MLPGDNIESENFQMWHDWHGKEAWRGVKEVHDCPLSPCCSLAAAVFIFVFMPSLWSSNSMSKYQVCEENWIEKINALRGDYFPSSRKMENPNFSVCLCLIQWDQILLSGEERNCHVRTSSLELEDLPHNMNFWHKIIHFLRIAHWFMSICIIWAALEQ